MRTKNRKVKFNWLWGFVGFLGFLGFKEPLYFVFFLFFLEPVIKKSKK